MKKSILFLMIALAAVLTGCTTYYRDSTATYLTRPDHATVSPYHTEFTVENKRIEAEGEASVLFGLFQIAENKRCLSVINPNLSVFSILEELLSPTFKAVINAKSVALYNACSKYNADQLMGVTFDYVIKDYLIFATVHCRVKGFPATVKGVKMVDKKPIILNKWQKIEYIAPYEFPKDLSGKQPVGTFKLTDFLLKK